jgi:biopolymer transport protein ExbB/TolQ
MKKIGFVLIASLFLIAWGFYVFAQTPPPAAPADAGIPAVMAPAAGGAPNMGLIKGKVTDTVTPRANNLDGAEIVVESELLLTAEGGKKTATSDSAGNYEVANLPPGEYAVTISKREYDTSTDFVTVTPGGEAFHDARLYKTDTVMSYFWKTGPIRWPLLITSIVGLTYVIERAFAFYALKPKMKIELFVQRITDALRSGNVMEAVSICEEDSGPLANVIKAGLLRYSQRVIEEKAITKDDITEAISEAAMLEIPLYERNMVVLSTIYQTATMWGLFGTVTGMVNSFTVIALKGNGDPQLLAGGISEALLTTVIGLATAIPTMIVYQYYLSIIDRRILEIQQVSTDIVNTLVIERPNQKA